MNAFVEQPPSPRPFRRIAVIGGGAWGTALAATAVKAGRDVTLWARRPEIAHEIAVERRNRAYLGDVDLPVRIKATAILAEALAGAEMALLVVPSRAVRDAAKAMRPALPPGAAVVVCAKGVEASGGLLMSAVVSEEAPDAPVGALSGPTFAAEVARDLPTAVVAASAMDGVAALDASRSLAARTAVSLTNGAFRVDVSDDVVGVEVGGAMKNVVAIACGVADGAGFGANMRAALLTQGLGEIRRLSEALGGRPETAAGLSGLGDLSLTCASTQSRNLRFGVQLGQGLSPEQTFDGEPVVVEGAANAVSITDLARRHGVRLPIAEAVRRIVHDRADIADTMTALWSRPLEAETTAIDLALTHPAPDLVEKTMEELVR